MIRVTENLGVIRDLLAKAAWKLAATRARSDCWPSARNRHLRASAQPPRPDNAISAKTSSRRAREDRAIGRNDLTWHFIGHLQSNKTRAVATHFDWVHTVDRLKVAQRLSQQRPNEQPALNICLQVNIDNEPGKSGIAVADILPLAQELATHCQKSACAD